VDALLHGLRDALALIAGGDSDVVATALRTLRVALESTAIAAVLGLPAGCLLGLGRFRGQRTLLAVSNAAMRFPPVAVGQVLWLLLWPTSRWGGGPLAGLGWIYTFDAVILAQTLLALPIVVALTAAAVQRVPTAGGGARAARGAHGRARGDHRRHGRRDLGGRRDPDRRRP